MTDLCGKRDHFHRLFLTHCFGFRLPTDLDHQVPCLEVIGKPHAGSIGVTHLDLAEGHFTNGSLRIEVKFPDRRNPLLVELKTARHRLLPGEEIENSAPERKFAASCHLRHTLVGSIRETGHHGTGRSLPACSQCKQASCQVSHGRNQLSPLRHGNDGRDRFSTGKPPEHGQTLRGCLRIRQT